jgi:hypothetical protein
VEQPRILCLEGRLHALLRNIRLGHRGDTHLQIIDTGADSMLYNFLRTLFTNVCNKLECFFLAKPSQPSLIQTIPE